MITDVFCKIISKELSANIVAEDYDWLAIDDIHPQAPIHVLIMPKKHFTDLEEVDQSDAQLLGRLLLAANQVAEKLNLDKGFRLIINRGEDGGQVVPHFHIHLLGGKRLGAKIVNDTK
jgi:histidine triad (HIT) family protein